jgi:hypothetical protein
MWLDRAKLSGCVVHLLQESLSEYVIMWDDDIKPAHNCLAAYVDAFHKHPQVPRLYDAIQICQGCYDNVTAEL